MTFGEKLKDLRLAKQMTPDDLAKRIGTSRRTIYRYESGDCYPRDRDVYYKLAEIFSVNVNYLLAENEEFMTEVGEMYGRKGQVQAEKILGQTRELFAGGTLSDEEKVAFLTEMQMIFLDSKKVAREKFTPKKYRTGANSYD